MTSNLKQYLPELTPATMPDDVSWEIPVRNTTPDDVLWEAFTYADWMEVHEGEPIAGKANILSDKDRKFYLMKVSRGLFTAEVALEDARNRNASLFNQQAWDEALGAIEELWVTLSMIEAVQSSNR